jgi:hypothetical protein
MAPSCLDWAFNNPEESDILVVLTTAKADEYRARRSNQPTTPASSGSALSPSCDTGRPVVEELYGHKLVLKSHSEFFKAAANWSISTGSSPAKPQVAVLSLSDERQFGTAKRMLRFMYTQRLDGSVGRAEVIRLMQLADEFSVPNLRHACMARLAASPLGQWSLEERLLLCSCWASVGNDCLAQDELAEAANLLADNFAAHFMELEEALADGRDGWVLLYSLPQPVVLRILSNDHLVVRSENTVLVAALSWLREAGEAAPEAERKEVIEQVRLLQLSPWFLSWFMFHAPEARLIAPVYMAELVRYLSTVAELHLWSYTRGSMVARGSAFLQRCATPRAGVDQKMTCCLDLAVGGQALREAVAQCLTTPAHAPHSAGRSDSKSWTGPCRFFNGVLWSPYACVDRIAGTAELWVGLMVFLKIGSEEVSDTVTLRYGSNFRTVVNGVTYLSEHHDAMQLGAGTGRVIFKADPTTDEDPQAILGSLLEDGRLLLKYTVLE